MALLSKNTIRKIESELQAYPYKILEVSKQRDSIINDSKRPDVTVSGGEIGNTTMNKGLRLAEVEGGWVELIQDALVRIPMEQKILIELRYFRGHNPEIVADKLHISRSLYYAWRDNMLYNVVLMATKKGLLDPFV